MLRATCHLMENVACDRGMRRGYLEFRHELIEGPRHYLCGRPVLAGDILDVLTPDGNWIRGRYEWTCDPQTTAWLFVGCEDGPLSIAQSSLVRWPYRM